MHEFKPTFGSNFREFWEGSKFSCFHGIIKENSFPVYTILYLFLRLENFSHKYMGLDQCLGQISWNSMNVQYLAILHGLLKQVRFRFYTNL